MAEVAKASSAAESRAEEACRLLVRLPNGEATPGQIGDRLAWNGARQAEAIRAAKAAGWVEGPKTRIRLTAEGWARFRGAIEPEGQSGSALEVLRDAFEGWPECWRAFCRLLVASLVYRHHHGEEERSGVHLVFLVVGPTGTGKSSAAGVVMDLFGWDRQEHTLEAHRQTEGSLVGRRRQVEGGAFVWEPAPEASLPFVLVDELGKRGAESGTARAVAAYAQGTVRVKAEGEMHPWKPTAMLVANPPSGPRADRFAVFPPEYRRRAVVLDTETLRGRRGEIDAALEAWDRRTSPPRLRLEQLRPPAVLGEGPSEMLRSVRHVLTEAGQEAFDFPAMRRAALGYLALLGEGAREQEAVVYAITDYLTVTETLDGEVDPSWRDSARSVLEQLRAGGIDGSDMATAMERSRVDAERAAAEVHQARRERASISLAIQHEGETLAAHLEQLRTALEGTRLRNVSAAERAEATALRKTLGKLLKRASAVQTEQALEDVRHEAEPYELSAATIRDREQQIRDQREREKAAETQRRTYEREQAARDRKAEGEAARLQQRIAKNQRQQERTAADARLRDVRALAKPLEDLYRRKNPRTGVTPLQELAAVRVLGMPIGQLRTVQQPREGRGLLSRILEGGPVSHWSIFNPQGEEIGRLTPASLSKFGAGTRQAIAPWLEALYLEEEQLERFLGRRSRAGRLALEGGYQMGSRGYAELGE